MVLDNKPLGFGYEESFLKLPELSTKWNFHLVADRVSTTETATERAPEQLKRLLAQPELGLPIVCAPTNWTHNMTR